MVLRVFYLRAGELTYTQTPAGFLWESAGIKKLFSPLHVWPALSIGSEFFDKEMQVETWEAVQSIADFSCKYEYPSSVPRICLKDILGVWGNPVSGDTEKGRLLIFFGQTTYSTWWVLSQERPCLKMAKCTVPEEEWHSEEVALRPPHECANTCTCMYTTLHIHTQWGADKSGQQALPKKE